MPAGVGVGVGVGDGIPKTLSKASRRKQKHTIKAFLVIQR